MKSTKICGFKLKKAQHIVELALLAPFIMLFVGIVYQIAITIHTNYKFNSSLYEAISFIALTNKIVPESDLNENPVELKNETVRDIQRYAQILLQERHAPYKNSLELKLVNSGDVDFLIGMYRYTSTFKIFNGIEDFNPENYNYLTVIPVNSAILKRNSYNISDDFFENAYEIAPYKEETEEEGEGEETEAGGENGEENTNETEEAQEPDEVVETNTSNTLHSNNIEIPEVQF